MTSNYFKVVKCPTQDMVYGNCVYFAPATFPEHVSNVQVEYKKIKMIFKLLYSDTVKAGYIALNAVQRSALQTQLDSDLCVNPIIVDNIAASICATINFVNTDGKYSVIPINAEKIKEQFIVSLKENVVSRQQIAFKAMVAYDPVLSCDFYANIEYVLSTNHTELPYALINENTKVHFKFDKTIKLLI